ncbi:hypothetical protein ETAA8_07010 [Anatilimnocola aggregata]|uniref:Uncharacterized protein n=1 Tax=Anatilimnocola aggregata TaxID=2528021 RepID=A0A517Y5W9_9BACT|nr:hypothetical protein [Anatilimnocola aggregata]QDU25631.1 hypothetical protein ETAA8_07010 [Anatilimnocola aggregata]
MKHFATGGTDSALLGLFWPELLPDDFDERVEEGSESKLFDELAERGTVIQLPGEAEGNYSLVLCVDEPLPAELRLYSREVKWLRKVKVAGESWFGGLEYAFKTDRTMLGKRPGMCSPVAIAAGEYEATIYATDVPDEVYEAWLVEKSSPSAKRLWDVQSWFAATGVVATMIFVGCLFFGTRPIMFAALAVAFALSLIAWVLSRTRAYLAVQQARHDYEESHPDFVICLQPSK